jgi:hypothetical protein
MTRERRPDEELAEEQRQRRIALRREARAKVIAAGINGPLTDPALAKLVAALDAYNACQARIADLSDQLVAAVRERDGGPRRPDLYDRVRLVPDYAEHVDNVGENRIGRLLKIATSGDWDGFARVDFTVSGGRMTWVPYKCLVPA